MKLPSAETPALITSETSSRKPMPSTIVKEMKRWRMVDQDALSRLGRDFPDGIERVLKLPEQARRAQQQRHQRR